jgi:hypothetical protein
LNSGFNFDAMALSMAKGHQGPYVDAMFKRLSDFVVEYVMGPFAQFEAGAYANRESEHANVRTIAYGVLLLWFCVVITPFRAESLGQLAYNLFRDCLQHRTFYCHTNVDKTRSVKVPLTFLPYFSL